MDIHVLPNQTTMGSEHEFGDHGFDDNRNTIFWFKLKISSNGSRAEHALCFTVFLGENW